MPVTAYLPDRVAKLYAIYLAHAEQCMREMPDHYAPQVLAAGPRVNADRTFAVINGRGIRGLMIDASPSWKRTCKSLGIKHTFKALEAWLTEQHPHPAQGAE